MLATCEPCSIYYHLYFFLVSELDIRIVDTQEVTIEFSSMSIGDMLRTPHM